MKELVNYGKCRAMQLNTSGFVNTKYTSIKSAIYIGTKSIISWEKKRLALSSFYIFYGF